MPAAETKQFLWRRFKTFVTSFFAFNVPPESLLFKLTNNYKDARLAFLLNWVMGREGGKDNYKSFLKELIPQVTVVFTGV